MLEQKIETLTDAILKLTAALESAQPAPKAEKTEVPKNQDEPKSAPKAEKTEVPKNQDEGVSLQDLKDASLAKSREGFKKEVRALLAKMGYSKLHDMPESEYSDYLTNLGKIK